MSSRPDDRFASTRWTLVLAAADESAPGARDALAELCAEYWRPLYIYARRAGYSVDRAEDLTQAFFARFLEKRDVRTADPARGRFRSYLLVCFKHFIANDRDRQRAAKRGGGAERLALAEIDVETLAAPDRGGSLTPEALYEREWAHGVLERAVAQLRAECTQAGRAPLFAELEASLLGERHPGGYGAAASALGMTEGAVKVTIHRLRRRLRELLKAQIAPMVSDAEEIDDEMRYLMAIVSR